MISSGLLAKLFLINLENNSHESKDIIFVTCSVFFSQLLPYSLKEGSLSPFQMLQRMILQSISFSSSSSPRAGLKTFTHLEGEFRNTCWIGSQRKEFGLHELGLLPSTQLPYAMGKLVNLLSLRSSSA